MCDCQSGWVNLIGVKAWVDWAIWLLWRYIEGMVDLPGGLLWRRLRVCPVFYSLLGLFRIWAISGDVPFVFSMEETILPLLPWFLVFILALLLIVFFCLLTASVMLCFVLPRASIAVAGYSLAALC